jgi:hypothetical protein
MPELECKVSLQEPEGNEPAEAAQKCASADRGVWFGVGFCFWLGVRIAAKVRPQQA